MSSKLTKAIRLFVNKDSISMLTNNLISLIKGPIVMLLIPMFLTEVEQGYWYTIGSLSALSTFADLGFGTLVGQFSAHEFSKLRFDKSLRYEGEKNDIERISSLYKYVLKWALCVCLVAYPLIMGVGIAVLNTHGDMSSWIIPWIIYMLAGGLSFIVRISLSFFEGCNLISKIQTNYCIGAIALTGVTIGMLIGKCGLYALAIPAVISFIINFILMFIVFRHAIIQLLKTKIVHNYHWGRNFLALIWRYAISWASGYFIFQIYTPLAFMVYDPVMAGKVGITMTLIQACFYIANTFNAMFIPKVNISIANREWGTAESLCKKGLLLSMPLYILGATIIMLALGLGQGKIALFDRFLPASIAVVLVVAWFFQMPINVIATYGRAHKQEPFLGMSVFNALFTMGSTVLIVFTLPINYLFMGFALSNIVSVFIFVAMYFKQKDKWHQKLISRQELDKLELEKELENELNEGDQGEKE